MMKLTVWQQFSSNHSNSFTVVGIFPDEQQAKKTYTRIRTLIKEIDAWYEENELDKYESWSTSEPEKAIGKEFRFSWDDQSPDAPTDFDLYDVSHFRNIVQISPSADSWTRRKPYETLLRRMGAKVAGYDNAEQDDDATPTYFRAKITATLPSEDATASFVQKWLEKIEVKQGVVKRKGAQITISRLRFDLDQFSDIVKALEKLGSTDLDYKLTRAALDRENDEF
jgi:hypothetical protein